MGRAYQNRKESMAKTSDAKARVYSKYGREIYVCAKAGGLDPAGNLALRSLIERAKKDQVPTHVIDKAIEKAKGFGFDLQDCVMASDAFFPFPDCVEIAFNAGVRSVIQPGGSIKDQLSVDFCDANKMSMVFSGIRHFKH